MLDSIKKAGIIGAGGAGFPTHIKLGAQADTFIVNAAECEPLLHSDRTLMLEKAEQIIAGIIKIRDIIQYKKAYIGIKKKNADCAEALEKFIDVPYIEIFLMDNVYPSGDEQVMIYEITGRTVPEGGIPLDLSVVVNNVETVYRIYRAIEHGEPYTRRFVTVTGKVKKPFVAELAVGTPFRVLFEKASAEDDTAKYIAVDGGPMMGSIVDIDSSYVRKTTSGVIFLPEDHTLVMRKRQNLSSIISQARASCCNCMTCTELCSRYLIGHAMEPHKIMRSICSDDLTSDIFRYANLCSECNICELYACPINLSPKTVNAHIKSLFRDKGGKVTFEKRQIDVPDFRKGRQITVTRLVNRLDLASIYSKTVNYFKGPLNAERYLIFTDQHIGAPSETVVKKGDRVKKGDILARMAGEMSSDIHSPFDAEVTEVSDNKIMLGVV